MTVRPFVVNVVALRKAGSPRRERRRGRLPGLRVTGSAVPDGAELEADVVLEPVDGGVVVTGTVRAPWEGECRRCLNLVRGDLEVPVRELYEPRETGGRGRPVDPDREEETYPLAGDQLDLGPLVSDAVLLELPPAPLCREDCPGLCPTCGADLNDGPCADLAHPADPRWAVLDVLREGGTS